jgi:hypothetical protein
MNSFRTTKAFNRGAAPDLWRNTLAQIPTVFGRLVYLTSLRNPNSGDYEHHGLADLFGSEEANRAMRDSHTELFAEWLCFDLQQQKEDLETYLSEIEGPRRVVLQTWLRLEPYRGCMPASTREVERALFLSDLEMLLALLRNEYGVAGLDQDA